MFKPKTKKMKKILFSLVAVLLFISANSQNLFPIDPSLLNHQNTPNNPSGLAGVNMDGSRIYGYNLLSGYFTSYRLPDLDNPLDYNQINYGYYISGDFTGDGDYLYVINYDFSLNADRILYKEDFSTGTVTQLGTITGIPFSASYPYYWGMAWDNANGNLYVLVFNYNGTWDNTSSYIYKIDLNSFAATLICQITTPEPGICFTLAYSLADENLYTVFIDDDGTFLESTLLRINPSTGVTSVVSGLGITDYYIFPTESDFNDMTGKLIYFAMDQMNFRSNVYNINPLNGNCILAGTIEDEFISGIAVNTLTPVPLKWYYFMLVFLIPIAIIIFRRKLF